MSISNRKYLFLIFLSNIEYCRITCNDCSSKNAKKLEKKIFFEKLASFSTLNVRGHLVHVVSNMSCMKMVAANFIFLYVSLSHL